MLKKLIYLIILVAVLWVAWYLISPLWRDVVLDEASPLDNQDYQDAMDKVKDDVVTMEDEMPSGPQVLLTADFKPGDHDVDGKALVIETDGNRVLRFEDFNTINGPNLHIYLSSDLTENDYVDLGPIRATKGNVNYELDPSIDLDKYNNVLVWCVPFKVLFSYAELK